MFSFLTWAVLKSIAFPSTDDVNLVIGHLLRPIRYSFHEVSALLYNARSALTS